MATIINGKYSNNLRCELVHDLSKSTLTTDAPLDNNGKGEKFSPTDLLAAGLGSCMLTIIGMRAVAKNINIGSPKIHIEKIMSSNPRAIKEIIIEITFFEKIQSSEKEHLESEARKCPVALSLSEKITQNISFKYI